MPRFPKEIEYSDKYKDDFYEYRHVALSKEAYEKLKKLKAKNRILAEKEWRGLGIQQSRGWVHFMSSAAEPNILLFRRPIGTNQNTGEFPPDSEERKKIYEEEKAKFLSVQNPILLGYNIIDKPLFKTKL